MKTTTLALTVGVGFVSLALGCSGPNEVAGLTTTSASTRGDSDHVCPMGVPGSSARAIDTPGGVALELTTRTSAADEAELERRARLMSSKGMLGRMAGPGGGVGMRGARQAAVPVPASEIRVDDVPHGVRIVMVARDPTLVDLLRARAHAHAQRMGTGTCGER